MRSRQKRVATAIARAPKAIELLNRPIGAARTIQCPCTSMDFRIGQENASNEVLIQCVKCQKLYKLTAALLTTSKKVA